MPPRPSVKEEEIEESFLKGSGPGGQKINKTSSAVQLKHLPTGIVVKSQATRSRSQNRKIARKILAEKLEFMERGPESRLGALAERDRKKKASKSKKAKRKYTKLEADRQTSDSEGDEEGHAGDGEGESADEQDDRTVGPKLGASEPRSASVIEGKTVTGTRSEVTALNDSKPPNSGKDIND
ncbi:RF-1 domain-domain-containing protein [Tuber borchii]|uniref:RF-1 domain-domain-containing protein n=1 Tax=Tuber borchii TaxID=42251 RepID=A0A2T6ZKR5_TUBBO|nr:RF-1 domain-domain-containing protein [Tuber borchii]